MARRLQEGNRVLQIERLRSSLKLLLSEGAVCQSDMGNIDMAGKLDSGAAAVLETVTVTCGPWQP